MNVDDETKDRADGDKTGADDGDKTDDHGDKTVPKTDEASRGSRVALRVNVGAVVLVLLLLVSSGLAAWLYFSEYRPDKQTDSAADTAVVTAAREGTIALLSYKPETLDQDFTTAKSHLTGDFLSYYEKFTREIVTPAAQQKAVATTAQVVGAAVSELHPDSAVVMVFVNQTTTSRDRPEPAMSASTVLVSMTKANGKWLIMKFDPV